jgi:PHD/YefM family antitoxin component YafN of YafNO toxin-antitoxin module
MKKLQEILNLVKETGDKLIVMDPEGDPYIVMNLANYRSLLREESKVAHLTEEELLEKINHLVAAWKSGQPDLVDYDLAQFRVSSIRRQPSQPFGSYNPYW